MFEGTGGFEYGGYAYSSSPHTSTVTDKCVACHFDRRRENGTIPPYTGHLFTPQGVKCLLCHHDFDTTAHSFDYRGIQTEIAGLTATLEGELASATHEDSLTPGFLRAQFNRDFVVGDLSTGIHNTDYARALLVSSIAEFNPGESLSATISTPHPPVVIPPEGGSFTYIMSFMNNTSSTQTVDIWTKLQKPNGSLTIVFGPKRKTLPAQATRAKSRLIAIPGSYAAGEYHLVLCIGTFESIILSSDTLDFTKSATAQLAGEGESPTGSVLYQNYPNPFNPMTEIRFVIGERQAVNLTVYNLVGQEVATLINENLGPGEHQATWDASGAASGLYFYRLRAGSFSEVKKFVVAK